MSEYCFGHCGTKFRNRGPNGPYSSDIWTLMVPKMDPQIEPLESQYWAKIWYIGFSKTSNKGLETRLGT